MHALARAREAALVDHANQGVQEFQVKHAGTVSLFTFSLTHTF
jgi:hypothetical protein